MNVVEQVIEEARQELAKGKKTAAARLLTDAAYRTRDPQEAETIIKSRRRGTLAGGLLQQGPLGRDRAGGKHPQERSPSGLGLRPAIRQGRGG